MTGQYLCCEFSGSKSGTAAVFYFGDLSPFVIQENSTGLEVAVLKERYSLKNELGFQLNNLLDGKLIYS
ncbi:phage major capsid family protein [Bacillus cereus]|uniref:phage major capsid family protein n=1 Tax=Bacillus cereus TaxID=1396 RepID=UPI000A3B4F9B|nr:phage major capsid protein [Bacillus cereus]